MVGQGSAAGALAGPFALPGGRRSAGRPGGAPAAVQLDGVGTGAAAGGTILPPLLAIRSASSALSILDDMPAHKRCTARGHVSVHSIHSKQESAPANLKSHRLVFRLGKLPVLRGPHAGPLHEPAPRHRLPRRLSPLCWHSRSAAPLSALVGVATGQGRACHDGAGIS